MLILGGDMHSHERLLVTPVVVLQDYYYYYENRTQGNMAYRYVVACKAGFNLLR